MKNFKAVFVTALSVACLLVFGFSYKKFSAPAEKHEEPRVKGCVFRTVMGEESSEGHLKYKTPEEVLRVTMSD